MKGKILLTPSKKRTDVTATKRIVAPWAVILPAIPPRRARRRGARDERRRTLDREEGELIAGQSRGRQRECYLVE